MHLFMVQCNIRHKSGAELIFHEWRCSICIFIFAFWKFLCRLKKVASWFVNSSFFSAWTKQLFQWVLRCNLSQDRKSNSYSIESEEFQWALRSVLVIYWRKQEMDLLLDRSNVVNHLNSVSGWRKRLWRASPATNKSKVVSNKLWKSGA